MIRPDDLTPEERRQDAIDDERNSRPLLVHAGKAKAILAEFETLKRNTTFAQFAALAVIAMSGEKALNLLHASLRDQGHLR